MKKFSALLLALVTASSFAFNQSSFAKSTNATKSDTIQVAGYTKKDGTVVKGYTRKRSSKSAEAGGTAAATKQTGSSINTAATSEKTDTTKVDANAKKDDTKVAKHKRSK